MHACRTSKHRLATEIGWWSTILIFIEIDYAFFSSYDAVENEAHFVLKCPLYNSNRAEFHSIFENVELGSLKSILQLDHQVIISLYLTEATALCHSRELGSLTPSWWIVSRINLMASLHSISFHSTTHAQKLQEILGAIVVWHTWGPLPPLQEGVSSLFGSSWRNCLWTFNRLKKLNKIIFSERMTPIITSWWLPKCSAFENGYLSLICNSENRS